MEQSVSDTIEETTSETPDVLLETICTRLPEPAVVVDDSLTVLAANTPLATYFDRDRQELVDESLSALFPTVTTADVRTTADADGDEDHLTVRCAGDPDRWLDIAFERHRADGETRFLGVGHDITRHRERERTLGRYERVLETVEDGVYVVASDYTIEMVNSAVEAMTGYDAEELVGSPATALADESALERAAELTSQMRHGDRDVAMLTTEITTADGETVPVETRFSTYPVEDGDHRQVGVIRDISDDRRQFAETLSTLHDSTRQLLRAETKREVATLIADVATEVPSLAGATIYLFDRGENVLHPTAVSGTFEGTDPPAVTPDDGLAWDVFVDNESVTLAGGDRYRPLDDHGVFHVQLDTHEEDDRTQELVDLLASSAQAALRRVDRETTLREREAERRRQNEELRRLKEVNAIIRRVDRVLVDADTVEAIEQAVCEELVDSRWFTFAWLGRNDGDTVEPRTWAGRSESYLDSVSQSTAREDGPPAVRTVQSESRTVVPAIADDLRGEHWRTEAISRDFQSAISVPLQYDEFVYGVLTVYADQPSRFGDTLETVFTELGERIANAIQEIETRQRQAVDGVVELELGITAPDAPIARFARYLDATVTCEGAVPTDGETTRLFVRLPDTEPSAVRDASATIRRIEAVSVVSDGELYELRVAEPTIPRTLLEQGAQLDALAANGNRVDATIHLAADADVRTFVERLSGRYPEVDLTARRERDVAQASQQGIRGALADRLTDRQREALRTAYISGFFDWPRETTGEEVAAMLDVSQPTVNRHLRVSERKLLELVFEEC